MRAMIDRSQRTTGDVVQSPRRGTGWAPPRNDGTASPDSLASRMKDSIMVFPESVYIVYPKPLPKPRTGIHPSGADSHGSHD